MRKCAFLLVSALLIVGGCGVKDKPRFTEEELARIPPPQRNGLPECSGGFVLAVGDETITADEIVLPLMEDLRPIAQGSTFEQFKGRAGPEIEQIITTRILNILLYRQARKQSGEDIDEALEKLAEAELRKFVDRFEGDEAKADEALKRLGMNRQSFKEYQKRMILNQSYVASKMPDSVPITYSELLACYDEMKGEFFAAPATIKFRLIDIKVAELEVANPNQERRQQAQKLASEWMGRIQEGEDFSELAEQYFGVSFVGCSEPVRPESLVEPYDICAVEAEKMEPGRIRLLEAEGHIIIMKLEGKWPKGFKPLEEVQGEVEEKIVSDRRRKAVDGLESELLQQAELGEKDAFVDFCLKKIYRMSNQ